MTTKKKPADPVPADNQEQIPVDEALDDTGPNLGGLIKAAEAENKRAKVDAEAAPAAPS